jgi:hypothetical protein
MFHPRGLRPHVTNWDAVAASLIQRVHREAVCGVANERTKALLAEVLAFPGVPKRWSRPDVSAPLTPFVPVSFQRGELTASFFSAVTTLGTPQDITLQEMRIECLFPADDATARGFRAWTAARKRPKRPEVR